MIYLKNQDPVLCQEVLYNVKAVFLNGDMINNIMKGKILAKAGKNDDLEKKLQ